MCDERRERGERTSSPGGAAEGEGRRGFSILELVVVLTIIAAFSAVAAPRYARSLDHYRADAAARRIVADLTLARTTAQATGAHVAVIFNVDADSYAMPLVADENNAAASTTVDLTRDPYKAALQSVNLSGSATVTFDGYGQPDRGGIIVIGSGASRAAVVLDLGTGKPTAWPYPLPPGVDLAHGGSDGAALEF